MTNKTCSYCGAERNFVGTNDYDCGSNRKKPRTPECYERQIAIQAAEIERLRLKRVKHLRDRIAVGAMQGNIASGGHVFDFEKLARWAYDVADAMLKARGDE